METPRKTARTVEERQDQAINLAYELAEKQLRDGTASAMVTTHFLKLATEKERLEREKLENETKLSLAKSKQMEKAPLQNAKMAATWDAIQWKANEKRSMAILSRR